MKLGTETRWWLYKIAVGLGGVILIVLTVWVGIAGPVTVLRIIRYGDTKIDDFRHYPGRNLLPSDTPFQFLSSTREFNIPADLVREFGSTGELDQILSSNDTLAFLIIQDDTILYERYFHGHSSGSLSQSFSMAKSFTSVLIGMAIDDGYIKGIDQPITDFVPELANSGFSKVKIHHLLSMMSGSSYTENDNPFGEHVILNYTPQLENKILNFKLDSEPGDAFRYKSGDNALLALALDRSLGEETITEYTQRRLWSPLGMEDVGIWTLDHAGDGLEKTWCCLAATARDFAKVGRLYLEEGNWAGEQILSADWIEQSTNGKVPEAAWPPKYFDIGWSNYGYSWWLANEEAGDYFALGKDGQFLYINPYHDLIILRLGRSTGELSSSQWVSLFQSLAKLSD
jgi:CubicO group peptidase (beta-lactamase class C family)